MRKSLISLILAVLCGVCVLLISKNFSPFVKSELENVIQRYGITETEEFYKVIGKSIDLGVVWEFLDFKIVAVWSFFLFVFIVSFIVAIHTFLDKLFFKSITEEPNLLTAFRRGILVFFAVFVFLGLRLMGAFVWYTAGVVIILLIVLESGIVFLKKP